jgi:hypothetical protein
MENHAQTAKPTKEEKILQDTYNDEYWAKEYDVSVDELKKTDKVSIFDKIIDASMKHSSFKTA